MGSREGSNSKPRMTGGGAFYYFLQVIIWSFLPILDLQLLNFYELDKDQLKKTYVIRLPKFTFVNMAKKCHQYARKTVFGGLCPVTSKISIYLVTYVYTYLRCRPAMLLKRSSRASLSSSSVWISFTFPSLGNSINSL